MMQTGGPPQATVATPTGAVVQLQLVTVQPIEETVTAVVVEPRQVNWKGMASTGTIQIILGILTICLGIVARAVLHVFYRIGYPFWCGLVFYIVAGIVGVVAGKQRSSRVATRYLVMSILACLASCAVITFTGVAISHHNQLCPGDEFCKPVNQYVDVFLLVAGLMELFVSISGASMACGAVCCTTPGRTVNNYQARPQMFVAVQPQFVCPPQQATGVQQGQPQAKAYQLHPLGQATPQAEPAADFKYHVLTN